jgi:hypothetical protein
MLFIRALLFIRFKSWALLIMFLKSFGGEQRSQTDRMRPAGSQFDIPDTDK